MIVYGYSRISVSDSTNQSVSIENQHATIDAYAKRHWPDQAVRHCTDDGFSGGVPLSDRPEGGRLLELATKGDHLVVSKTDRLFRSVQDGAAVIRDLERRGVSLHLLDLNINTSNPMGRAMAHVAIVFAELERERIGERRKDANRHRRVRGLPTMKPDVCPVGWQIVRINGRREYKPQEIERQVAKLLLSLREFGMIYDTIVDYANMRGLHRRCGRPWIRSAVRRAIISAIEEFPLISEATRRWGTGPV